MIMIYIFSDYFVQFLILKINSLSMYEFLDGYTIDRNQLINPTILAVGPGLPTYNKYTANPGLNKPTTRPPEFRLIDKRGACVKEEKE